MRAHPCYGQALACAATTIVCPWRATAWLNESGLAAPFTLGTNKYPPRPPLPHSLQRLHAHRYCIENRRFAPSLASLSFLGRTLRPP
jgi:hypothetical protein